MIFSGDVKHHFAQVADDVSLHFIDVGPRDATPLVLVHGWPDLWFAWRYQIGPLSKKYRVIAPDLRGFGRSSASKDVSKYGAKNVTGDLAKLLDILKIEKAVFIGHDWGGAIVWRMALYHPTRVHAMKYMKLLSQPAQTAPLLDAAPRKVFTAMFRHYTELCGDVSVYDMIKSLPDSNDALYTVPSSLLSKEEFDVYEGEYKRSGFQSTLNYYATRAIDFESETGLSAIIPHNALYIGARDDRVLKPEMAAHMPKLMPRLDMTVIDDAGHWILWQQPQKVTETLLQWLEKVGHEKP